MVPRLVCALLLMWFAAAGMPAQAQMGGASATLDTCIARASPGDSAPAMFDRAKRRFDCDRPATSFGSGDFWVRSEPLDVAPIADGKAIRVRIASLWQMRTTLYARFADGFVARAVIDGRGASHRLQLGALIEQELPVRRAAVTDLLWHVEGAANVRGVVLAPTLVTAEASARSNLLLAALYAGFLGVAGALLLHNLALWAALRHRFQLSYCMMLAALILYAITSSGALAWLVPDIANNDRIRLNYLTLALAAAAALDFARSFFEPQIFAGWLGRAANRVGIGVLAAGAVFAAAAPWQVYWLDRLYGLSFVALIGVVAPMLWRAWRRRSNQLWLFAIAWAIPIAMAALRVSHNFHLLPWNFWLDNSTILAMTLEALMSGLAIAYRIRLLSHERDEAREQEIAARLLADSDPLTGLSNRRGFLRAAVGRQGRQRLFVVDIDHFKRVNDTLGHDGGDEVLRLVARALRQASPPDALVARFGGEEFVILADAAAAPVPVALLEHVRAQRMPYDIGVTVSVGCCDGAVSSDADWNALYRAADRALFAAKEAGRDRARETALAA